MTSVRKRKNPLIKSHRSEGKIPVPTLRKSLPLPNRKEEDRKVTNGLHPRKISRHLATVQNRIRLYPLSQKAEIFTVQGKSRAAPPTLRVHRRSPRHHGNKAFKILFFEFIKTRSAKYAERVFSVKKRHLTAFRYSFKTACRTKKVCNALSHLSSLSYILR